MKQNNLSISAVSLAVALFSSTAIAQVAVPPLTPQQAYNQGVNRIISQLNHEVNEHNYTATGLAKGAAASCFIPLAVGFFTGPPGWVATGSVVLGGGLGVASANEWCNATSAGEAAQQLDAGRNLFNALMFPAPGG